MSKPANDDDFETPETLLWQGGYAGRSMLGAWLGASVITVVLFVAVFRIQALREIQLVVWTMFGIVVVIWFGLMCLVVYRKLAVHYELSNQQLKHRSGILIRQIHRIEMIDIDDVSYRQGPIQALMDVGTIELLSSDISHPKLVMPGIGNVTHVSDLIDDARREERRKRGLHVESI